MCYTVLFRILLYSSCNKVYKGLIHLMLFLATIQVSVYPCLTCCTTPHIVLHSLPCSATKQETPLACYRTGSSPFSYSFGPYLALLLCRMTLTLCTTNLQILDLLHVNHLWTDPKNCDGNTELPWQSNYL